VTEHDRHLAAAIELSRLALERGDGPYGAVLVRAGEGVLCASNTVATGGDATRHAELNLLVEAQRRLGPGALAECTLYASTEPCAMCAGALYWAGVRRVVFGCSVERQVRILGGGLALGCRSVFAAADEEVAVDGPWTEDAAAAVLERSAGRG
jgi:tRNA(Arg) A34 adenosine deaminase TadA